MKIIIRILFFSTFILVFFGCTPQPNNPSGVTNPQKVPATLTYEQATIATAYPSLNPTGQENQVSSVQSSTAYPFGEAQVAQAAKLPEPPQTAPEPKQGLASVSGALYSYTANLRLGGTRAYLTPGVGITKDQMSPVLIGPRENMGDISFFTDDNANFEVNNIPPGKYFLIIWSPYTWSVAQISETQKGPLIIDLKPGDRKVLGVIYSEWP